MITKITIQYYYSYAKTKVVHSKVANAIARAKLLKHVGRTLGFTALSPIVNRKEKSKQAEGAKSLHTLPLHCPLLPSLSRTLPLLVAFRRRRPSTPPLPQSLSLNLFHPLSELHYNRLPVIRVRGQQILLGCPVSPPSVCVPRIGSWRRRGKGQERWWVLVLGLQISPVKFAVSSRKAAAIN